jgi:N-acetyl-gamma-glutamylphosphate reductase
MAGKARIGVLGAPGYIGAETVRLLLGHPRVEIALLTADRRAGGLTPTKRVEAHRLQAKPRR